jgi:flap endonuclease-1
MGIRYLNKFFREECKKSDSIQIISMNQLNGKKIAVDISIYLYKFASDDTLIENIYLMLSIFRHYNIVPLFVFDGKPPAEKKELLVQRLDEKKKAEKEFNLLKKNLEYDVNMNEDEKHEIINKMDLLKKKFVHVSRRQIEDVKQLIRSYGMTYCDAPNEADELCAMLTIKGVVWACLSEDMDMFIYGCPRVLRYLSLLNHTFVLYETKKILNKLNITQDDLREICVISGTDYNVNNDHHNQHNLFTTLKYFKKYKKNTVKSGPISFYNWLKENTNYIEIYDYEMYESDISMFILDTSLERYENISIVNTNVMYSDIKEILKKDGFIFPQ